MTTSRFILEDIARRLPAGNLPDGYSVETLSDQQLQDIVVALGTNMSQFFKEDERQEKVTFEEDDVYNQADGTGFVNLFGLPLKVRALMQEKTGLLK